MSIDSKFSWNIMRVIIVTSLAAIALSACSSDRTIRAEFNQSLEQYNESIRWQDLDKAGLFSSPSISEKFKARAEIAKKARITDYRILDVKYDEKAQKAVATVIFDYYMLTSATVKKVTDTQKWVYAGEGAAKSWKLLSLPPEFP